MIQEAWEYEILHLTIRTVVLPTMHKADSRKPITN